MTQWVEHPTGVTEVIQNVGSNPAWDSDFSVAPHVLPSK